MSAVFLFEIYVKSPASNAALFLRAAAIWRHRRYVADDRDIEADRLNRAHGGFASGARALHAHFDFFQPVAHGLPAGILRNHLGGVGRALARTLEAALARTRPADHVAGQVGNAH